LALALAVFAALALPYFRSMAEFSLSDPDPVPAIGVPAFGLVLLGFAAGGLFRGGSIIWLGSIPFALACLGAFKPSLVPAASFFLVGVCAVAAAGTRFAWLKVRERRDLWMVGLALASVLAAVTWFPRTSLPATSWIADYVSGSAAKWRNFFIPLSRSAMLDQPGFLGWFLLGSAAIGIGLTRSGFARIGIVAAFILVCGLGIAGALSQFLWLNCPIDFINVFSVAYDLRLLPVLAPLTAIVGFAWYTGLREGHPRLARAVVVVVLCLLPWTVSQQAEIVAASRGYMRNATDTANRFRTENIVLERYSWDLLVTPRFFSNGSMDAALESRFWRFGDPTHALIDPDAIERALEKPSQGPLPLVPTQIPTGHDWLSLAPKIELDPGQHVLIRFDFLGKNQSAWLILRGQSIYREYILPSSGTSLSFGSGATNGRTLSLWNSGTTHESIELLVFRVGPDHAAPPGPGPYYLAYVTPYDPAAAPIELYSLMPVHLRVEAPADGYLETFRSYVPGYKVYVDGTPATVRVSGNRLVSVWLKKGSHDVRVRFAGTVSLHTDERWAFTAWGIALLALLAHIALACRKIPNSART
jgi:hypothetical protein